MEVAAWLNGLGLDRYKQAFEDNAIDFALLPKLTADDLRDIGITAVGHRRKLLEAIVALQDSIDKKTFELRAATSLARLWSGRGDQQRARDLLAPIYDWFTDGFGTHDLIEAKALLDAIG